LLMDGVQCGHFRTGRFQSFQRILEGLPEAARFAPDGLAMAKSLGGGFPMGAFWVHERHAELLGPGTHGTTYGGTPLGCAVALKIFEVIERDRLADHARATGKWLKQELERLVAAFPGVLRNARGVGFMLGLELQEKDQIPRFANIERPASLQFVQRLHDAGLLSIPSGTQRVRFLPALNLPRTQAEEGIGILERVVRSIGR
jgi:acetylornithine/N-succinyldiaminopimelate aminotransferase